MAARQPTSASSRIRPSLPPELVLAAACSLWPPSARRDQAIREAASTPVDWDRFLHLVMRHEVLGLAHEGLSRVRPDMPANVARAIGMRAQTLAQRNLRIAAEAVRIQGLLAEAGVLALCLKGPALGMEAYGNIALRQSNDIDILVLPESLGAAQAILEKSGYRRLHPPPHISDAQVRMILSVRKDVVLFSRESGIDIELHHRLFRNRYLMTDANVAPAARIVRLSGGMSLRTLGDDDQFAYLCAHGALHQWQRLKWLADVAALLEAAPDDRVEAYVDAARARGVGRPAAQALLLCRELFDTPIPDRLNAALDRSAVVRWLAKNDIDAMAVANAEPARRRFQLGAARGMVASLLLGRGGRYALAECVSHLTAEIDVLTVPLPARLRFLYPLLRLPLWLWRRASRSRADSMPPVPKPNPSADQ